MVYSSKAVQDPSSSEIRVCSWTSRSAKAGSSAMNFPAIGMRLRMCLMAAAASGALLLICSMRMSLSKETLWRRRHPTHRYAAFEVKHIKQIVHECISFNQYQSFALGTCGKTLCCMYAQGVNGLGMLPCTLELSLRVTHIQGSHCHRVLRLLCCFMCLP